MPRLLAIVLSFLSIVVCVSSLDDFSTSSTDVVDIGGHWQPTVPGLLQRPRERLLCARREQQQLVDAEHESSADLGNLQEAGETDIMMGEYASGVLADSTSTHHFSFTPASLNAPIDIFVGVESCQSPYTFCDIRVLMNGSPFASATNATYSWYYYTNIRIDSSHPLSCQYRNLPLANCTYHFTLQAYTAQTNTRYFTTVMSPPAGVAELTSGRTQTGSLAGGASAYYYVTNGELREIMVFALTVTAGECDLYVSTSVQRPGPGNSTWSSRDDGDDLVIVNGTRAGAGGRPGTYYYVGVVNTRSTSSSYSIVGSSYTTTGNPLDNAWYLTEDKAQKDWAMASTYRYYYFYVEGDWPTMTITLDSVRGDADMSDTAQHTLPRHCTRFAYPQLLTHSVRLLRCVCVVSVTPTCCLTRTRTGACFRTAAVPSTTAQRPAGIS